MNLAQSAGASHFYGEDVIRFAEPLGSGLIDPPIPTRRLNDHLPLRHRQAGRFLTINILARPHGPDRSQRVPAVAGGDQHGLDIRALGQKLSTLFLAA